jgi:hypothetical protein
MRLGLIRSSLLSLPAALLSLSLGGCPPVGPGGLVFDRVVIDSAASGGATAVMVADFDGDGKFDVISAWKSPGEVRLHLQREVLGAVTWQTVVLASGSLAQGAQAVAVADLDGDNRPDALVATSYGRILYLHQLGGDASNPANWDVTVIGASQGDGLDSWSDVQVADVDADTQLEVIATLDSPGGRVCIFNPPTRPTNGTGWTRVDVATTGRNGAAQVIPIDMDADGAVDLLTIASGEAADSVVWYGSPGNSVALTGPWVRHVLGHVADPRAMALAYMDADPFIDIVVTTGSSHAIWGFQAPNNKDDLLNLSYRWVEHPVVSLGSAVGSSIFAADMDGDGVAEIISGTRGAGRLSLYNWDPYAGVWAEQVLDSTSATYGRCLVVDLDLSGAYDIICPVDGATSEIVWYRRQ